MCGSDVHKWKSEDKSDLSSPSKPVVTGHEIAGVVKEVGKKVSGFSSGDRVVCEIVVFYCGECVNCKTGRINICCNIPPIEQRAHYVTGGGFCPRCVWPVAHLHHLPDGITFKEAPLLEPTAGAVHSLVERMML